MKKSSDFRTVNNRPSIGAVFFFQGSVPPEAIHGDLVVVFADRDADELFTLAKGCQAGGARSHERVKDALTTRCNQRLHKGQRLTYLVQPLTKLLLHPSGRTVLGYAATSFARSARNGTASASSSASFAAAPTGAARPAASADAISRAGRMLR